MKIEEERRKREENKEYPRLIKGILCDVLCMLLSVFTVCCALVYLTILSQFFGWFQQGSVGIAMAGRQDG